jgi:hypothetical protein
VDSFEIGELAGPAGKRLISAIRSNEAVLFLGAGFSRGATNKLSKPLPTGHELGEDLGSFWNMRMITTEPICPSFLKLL